MSIDRLDCMFHPKSIAVVGASDRSGSVGQAVMHKLMDGGFEGPVYPVNVRHPLVMGKRAYTALSHIEDPVDQ